MKEFKRIKVLTIIVLVIILNMINFHVNAVGNSRVVEDGIYEIELKANNNKV